MASSSECFGKGPEIVDLAIKDNSDGSLSVFHWLLSTLNVHNREASLAKHNTVIMKTDKARIVRAALIEASEHGLHHIVSIGLAERLL